MRCFAIFAFVAALSLIAAVSAEPPCSAPGNPGPSVRQFMTPDGRIDINAVRTSGYQGPLDLSGVDVRVGPRGGAPTVSASTTQSTADDPDDIYWDNSMSPLGPGTHDIVNSLTAFDGKLIASGYFTTVGSDSAFIIASWDGSNWSALESGIGGWSVFALTVYDGKLVVGGYFTMAGGIAARGIASWDGSNWSALGWGVNSSVLALAVYDGKLIAGGEFLIAGGIAANYIASWDGSKWSRLGSGTNGPVCALTVYNGKLIAGGWFGATASWDGSKWSALGSGMNGIVYDMTVYDGKLIAGGQFWTVGDVVTDIASWDGNSWSALGSGVNSWVNALTVYDGKLIVGGDFTTAGGVAANRIACWDGINWSSLGSGMNDDVLDLTVYDSALIAGGTFTAAGSKQSVHTARWMRKSTQTYSGPVWYVSNTGSDPWYCGSNDQPFKTVSRAIASSQSGDTILVAAGTYYEVNSLDFSGKNLVLRAADGPDQTFLRPYGTRRVFHFHSGEDSTAVVDGFTITGGQAGQGGAILLAEGSNPTITNNTITGNRAMISDSADLPHPWSPLIAQGGAIYCDSGVRPTISFNTIVDNEARFAMSEGEGATPGRAVGGAIYCVGAAPLLKGNVFARNRVCFDDSLETGSGGAVYLKGSNVTLVSNTFVCNSTQFSPDRAVRGYGGGVYCDSSNISVINCLFAYNNGGGLYGSRMSTGSCSISCSNLYGNECVMGDWESLPSQARINGNMSTNPLFCDTSGKDFHLTTTSPCAPANNSCGVLIGAREVTCSPTDVSDESTTLPTSFALYQNYPNPFNPTTSIEYSVPIRAHVTVEIFNLLGQHVRTLVDQMKSPGKYKVEWDGTDVTGKTVSTGVYLYRLTAGDFVETKKMVLLK
jgi:hypothetical protein